MGEDVRECGKGSIMEFERPPSTCSSIFTVSCRCKFFTESLRNSLVVDFMFKYHILTADYAVSWWDSIKKIQIRGSGNNFCKPCSYLCQGRVIHGPAPRGTWGGRWRR